MKKTIIFYLNNDEIFTFPIALFLIKKLSPKYNIKIKLANTSIKKKIKIILIFILDGSIKYLFKYYSKKKTIDELLSFKNVDLITKDFNNKFKFGISLNYPNRILNKKLDIYNFHLGDFTHQRGTFIFFYKYIFKWKSIDFTFHKINNKLDSGKIINKRKIILKKINSINLIALTLKNKDFYLKSISLLNKKIRNKYKKKLVGPLNKEPSFFKILKTKFN